ncbi:MAG TPA: amidohydrolase family protein [Candidatus Thermoplasmatota archaeon]|nr:amidohydrolase family protein [Candidatus Thermoplasmatota archaeon]
MPGPMAKSEAGVKTVADARPGRFSFLQGGFSLNPMIHAVESDQVTASHRADFEAKAEAILAGGARGFGELAALHFSFGPDHPYEEVPPDHPLLLLLSDLAAKHDVPIDLHMELVAQDKPTPQRLRTISPQNPAELKENLAAFERLLSHNASARFTWVHVGFDNTGDMTPARVGTLLAAHPNLYLGVRIPTKPTPTYPQNSVLDGTGTLRAPWRDVLEAHPDRFLLGSDGFYADDATEVDAQLAEMVKFLNQVPASAVAQVARENAAAVYGLG